MLKSIAVRMQCILLPSKLFMFFMKYICLHFVWPNYPSCFFHVMLIDFSSECRPIQRYTISWRATKMKSSEMDVFHMKISVSVMLPSPWIPALTSMHRLEANISVVSTEEALSITTEWETPKPTMPGIPGTRS